MHGILSALHTLLHLERCRPLRPRSAPPLPRACWSLGRLPTPRQTGLTSRASLGLSSYIVMKPLSRLRLWKPLQRSPATLLGKWTPRTHACRRVCHLGWNRAPTSTHMRRVQDNHVCLPVHRAVVRVAGSKAARAPKPEELGPAVHLVCRHEAWSTCRRGGSNRGRCRVG